MYNERPTVPNSLEDLKQPTSVIPTSIPTKPETTETTEPERLDLVESV